LELRAKERGIEVKVVHNASVMNAIGCCGLQLYNYGQTVSIVLFTDTYKPDSFYDKIKANKTLGLHTLCLLDIKMKEPNLEMMAKGKIVYEAPRFMTINECISQLLEIEEKRQEGVVSGQSLGVGLARLGADTQHIVSGSFEELLNVDFGSPLHCFVIPGDMHILEQEALSYYRVNSNMCGK
jgi:diphthine methyl ester synthase